MTVEDLEKAVEQLSSSELVQFRAWFDEFAAARFDAAIEKDAASGLLDGFAEEALADRRRGRTREL
jgi:hypothetical protein